ncbi:MAG: hypothetical protein JWO97_4175 [Acidobacteria bacterium]|nr:hypothetical protein [Acidobacteriota bacterium]
MTPVLLAIAALFAYGVPATLMLDPRARGAKLAGLGLLYGSGIVFFAMLVLSVFDVPWTLPLIATIAFLLAATFRALRISLPAGEGGRRPGEGRVTGLTVAVHALTALTLISYAFYATLAPLWEWDFWAIWGLKARVFFEHRGLDWRFLSSEWNTFAHTDYPQLVTFNYDFIALVCGGWNDRWLGLLNVAFAIALLLVVYSLARREASPLVAALATLACAATAGSRYVGLAEGALIAFGGAGVLMVRAAIVDDDEAAMRHGALLLGFAASCKNEGVALLVAVAIALTLVSRRWLLRLWPSVVIIAPWMLLRAFHHLPTDLVEGNVVARFLTHLRGIGAIVLDLSLTLVDPLLWVALIAGVLVLPNVARRRERFVLLVVAIQLAFYIASYLVTPHDVHWHISTSWTRLTRHLIVPLTVVVVLALANWLGGGEDAAHAEARSEL